MKYIVTLRNKTYEVEVEKGEAMILSEYEAKAPVATAAQNPVAAPVAAVPATTEANTTAAVAGTSVNAPLPGNVLTIKVTTGQTVKQGEVLMLIEAMKMENEVCAPCDGTVKQILVTKGQVVATGDLLMVI